MEFSLYGIMGIATIAVICYLIGAAVKVSPLDNKYIPVICGTCGAVIGTLGFLFIPNFPASDILDAIARGIVSGFAATGINQAIKQLKGDK